jgi:hypothetical protein
VPNSVACEACTRSKVPCVRRNKLIFKMSSYVDRQPPATTSSSSGPTTIQNLDGTRESSLQSCGGDGVTVTREEAAQTDDSTASLGNEDQPPEFDIQEIAPTTYRSPPIRMESSRSNSQEVEEIIEDQVIYEMGQGHLEPASLSECYQLRETTETSNPILIPTSPMTVTRQTPVSASTPRGEINVNWPLADIHEATLLHYFCVHLAPWVRR